MKVLVLSVDDVKACLPLAALRDAMTKALKATSAGEALSYPRVIAPYKNLGGVGFMPSSNSAQGLFGYKSVAVFHHNVERGLNPHQGIVSLLNEETGEIKSLMDGSTVTALRTPAASAAATELLSRPDAQTLAIIGAGKQGYEHAMAIANLRPSLKHITIYNRSAGKAERVADALRKALNLTVTVAATPQQAVADADIVATGTSAKEPILKIEDFKPGAHINAAGACRPGNREIELRNRAGLKIYLDRYENCSIEADEVFEPLKKGTLDKKHVLGEVGEAMLGKIPGRQNAEEITFFKSVGIGVEDLYAAQCAYQNALQQKRGTLVDFGEDHEL